MLVSDVMVTDVVTCDVSNTLKTAVEQMLDRGIGSLIVTRAGEPFGIVTETDALIAGTATDRAFADIPLNRVVSHPLVTTTASTTIRKAVDVMAENEIKKLPVVDGLELEGILTRTDVASNYSEFIREAHQLDQRRDHWEARRWDIDDM